MKINNYFKALLKNRKIGILYSVIVLIITNHNIQAQINPDEKAKVVEQKMTEDERFSLLTSLVGYVPTLGIPKDPRIPDHIAMSAGYTSGIPRLNIPNLQSTDASMGVTNPGYRPNDPGATAMPASIVVGASFNPQLAYDIGVAIAKEARVRGFNILLAGGINLVRDARNGRNYEYYSEDPWTTALFGAAAVNGIQSQKVISTLKHFSLNNNEVNRHWLNAIIDPAAHRETDLLSFQIAIEKSNPGSIMSGYNKINGEYASGNAYLLNDILKKEWKYKGWVMSDWGAVPHWDYILKGLDQESGIQLDVMQWGAEAFTDSLRIAYQQGKVSKDRISDAVRRILRSVYAIGVDQWNEKPTINKAQHHQIALKSAQQGMVLLKNENILPLSNEIPLKIAVIGGYAHLGVICGTGSGAVLPEGGYAGKLNIGGPGIMGGGRTLYILPNSPLDELQKKFPNATFEFDPGYTVAEAKILAQRSDIVIAFGIRVEGEGFDLADLSLPWGQDQLIEEVAKVNPNTIVVLETGNATSMPWRNQVKAILQAWFPGQAGGTAIADIISGSVNPSGKLPMTFPQNLSQTPRPHIPEIGSPWGTSTTISYNEGSEIGYRWYALKNEIPMYPFGFGLSYTTFGYKDFKISIGNTLKATLTITNTGKLYGADVSQVYLLSQNGKTRLRLLDFKRVELSPGESKTITMEIEPRLLAHFDEAQKSWNIQAGDYTIGVGKSSAEIVHKQIVKLKKKSWK